MKDESNYETTAIRSDIENTRNRMDNTIDQLGNRLHGGHLFDEVLGIFRSSGEESNGTGEKIKRTAEDALYKTVDTVKSNPLPSLLIGAGVAWLILESTRDKTSDQIPPGSVRYDPDRYMERPLFDPGETRIEPQGVGEKISEAKDKLAEKASDMTEQARGKLARVAGKSREGMEKIGDRARQAGIRAKERTREAYQQSRERVAATANRHPLEIGLACLAAGLIAGGALPTPEKVERIAGPEMDRLRERTREAGREIVGKGQRVAEAATAAAKEEAQAQGLTPEAIRGEKTSAGETRRQGQGNQQPQGNQSGSGNSPT